MSEEKDDFVIDDSDDLFWWNDDVSSWNNWSQWSDDDLFGWWDDFFWWWGNNSWWTNPDPFSGWWMWWQEWSQDFVFATNKQAYWHALNNDAQEFKKTKKSFMELVTEFININKEIYTGLPTSSYILIWLLSVTMLTMVYLLKGILIYLVVYNYDFIATYLSWLETIVIMLIYIWVAYFFFDFIDWESKVLKTIIDPLKMTMIWISFLYLSWLINFWFLFNFWLIFVFLWTFIRVFFINELEKVALDKVKSTLGIENDDVKREVENLVKENQWSFLNDLPNVNDILLDDDHEEEVVEQYDLFIEILRRVKETRKSWVTVSKWNLYYFDMFEEWLPSL